MAGVVVAVPADGAGLAVAVPRPQDVLITGGIRVSCPAAVGDDEVDAIIVQLPCSACGRSRPLHWERPLGFEVQPSTLALEQLWARHARQIEDAPSSNLETSLVRLAELFSARRGAQAKAAGQRPRPFTED